VRIKTRPARDEPLWRGEGGQPRKNYCIGLPKYFTEILAMHARKQIGIKKTSIVKKVPSFLASVQGECLLKGTF